MGKATYKGFVPPDDPMFSTGPELISRRASTPSFETSPSATTGATRAMSDSAPSETEQDGKEQGALRLARWRHQNEQLKRKS